MSIGIGFALLFNLYMPDGERALKEKQQLVEETFKSLLKDMSIALTERKRRAPSCLPSTVRRNQARQTASDGS